MFAIKITVLFAILSASSRLVVASPPACLLAAVRYYLEHETKKRMLSVNYSTETNPADLSTICGADASKVESQITSLCGSNANAALQAFASSCSAAGKTVRTYTYKI